MTQPQPPAGSKTREIPVPPEVLALYRRTVERAEIAEHKLALAQLTIAQRDEVIQILRDTLGALQTQANLASAINLNDIAALKGRQP